MEKKIDLIMPFARMDHFVSEAIDSAFNSIGVDVRLIMVDDRTEKSKLVIDQSRNIKIIHSKEPGFSGAIRSALEHVTRPFFGFLDSDDLTHPKRLADQIEQLENMGTNISICGILKIDKFGKPIVLQPPLLRDSTILKYSNLIGSINSNSSWVCRNQVINDSQFMPSGFLSIDWATTLLLSAQHKVSILPSRRYLYRQHKHQMTRMTIYRQKAFEQIYPLWSEVNSSFDLPKLSLFEAQLVAAPWSESSKEFHFPLHWIQNYLESNVIRESDDFRGIIKILFRRIQNSRSISISEKIGANKFLIKKYIN